MTPEILLLFTYLLVVGVFRVSLLIKFIIMVRFPSEDRHAPVNSTVVAIDKDKNSHYAVRWAVEHLFNLIDNRNMILVHVRLKNSNRTYLSF